MNQGTRLLLFHEDGELKQVFFPKISPLWGLAFFSTLTLLTGIMMMLSLRLYHEKRELQEEKEELRQKVHTSNIKITELLNERRPPKILDFQEKFLALVSAERLEDFTSKKAPLELVLNPDPVELLDGGYRLKFGVMAKAPSENVFSGSVCGIFYSDNGIHFLPNSKTNEAWLEAGKEPSFKDGKQCESFQIKNAKWFEMKMLSPLRRGVIQVYNEDGQLMLVKNIAGSKQ